MFLPFDGLCHSLIGELVMYTQFSKLAALLILSGLIGLTISASAMASSDEIQVKTVVYKNSAGISQPLTLLGGEGDDWAREILCNKSDSCAVFGFTHGSFGDTTDWLAMQFTPSMTVQWAETYGGTNRDMLWHAIKTSDDGYFTIGESESMFFTGLKIFSPHYPPRPLYVKLDKAGKLLWAGNIALITDTSGAEFAAAYQTADGGYLLAGTYWEGFPESGKQPMPDIWSAPAPGKTKGYKYSYPLLLKLSKDGKPQWMRRYVFGENGGVALTATEMPSGHLFLTGAIYMNQAEHLFVLETDAQGLPMHAQELQLPQHLGTNAALRLQDGNYLVVGHAIMESTPHAAFSALFAPDLKFLGGTIYEDPIGIRPLGLVQGTDGRICVVGRTENIQSGKVEGAAWLIDEHGDDLDELWLSGQGNTELEGAVDLSSGNYRLLGDTNAFGAANYDLLLTTWNPAPSAATSTKQLTLEPFAPKINDIQVSSDMAKLDIVRPIPPSLFNVKTLTSESGSTGTH